MALIGLYVWWTVIPMAKLSVERRDREIDRGRRERLGLPADSKHSPTTIKDIAKDPSSQPLSPAIQESFSGETFKETR